MKIEINIDDAELQERVTEIVAKKFFNDFCAERRELREVVANAVKDVISTDREKIVGMAIDKATGEIAYGDAPKLVEKLAKEVN